MLGRYASHIAVIFPFEVKYFSPYSSPVTFVGNPTVEAMAAAGAFSSEARQHPGKENFRLAIIPGSRIQEIALLLPAMVGAFKILRQRYPKLRGMISRYCAIPLEIYRNAIGNEPLEIFHGPLGEMLNRSDIALVTSGTATLETALAGVPHVIAYRTSPCTYAIARCFVYIPDIGLPNIIAGKRIVPECRQGGVTPESLAGHVGEFIELPELYNSTIGRLLTLRDLLGEKKPSLELCLIVKGILNRHSERNPRSAAPGLASELQIFPLL